MTRTGTLLLAIAIALEAPRAHAGACGGGDEAEVKALEARARDPKAKADLGFLDLCWGDYFDDLNPRPALQRRVLRACETILGRDPLDVLCVTIQVSRKKTEVAGVSLFDSLSRWDRDPWSGVSWPLGSDSRTLDLMTQLGDRRAAPLVIETWKASVPEAERRERELRRWEKKTALVRWSRWRQQAAALLGALAEPAPDTIAFLEAQAAATKDRSVKRACTGAVKSLRKRSGGTSTHDARTP